MVSSINGSQSSSILAGLSSQPTSPSGSTASFTDQLASALEGFLAKAGNNSNLEIDIQSAPSQNSGVRQFIVTVKNPGSSPAQNDSTAGTAAASTPSSAPAQANSAPPQASAAPAHADAPDSTPLDDAAKTAQIRAEEDAYWAAQPEAVQQLRNVADFRERGMMAQSLADQGYTIDKAIMVWGWDPLKTMAARKMYGYTWVPNLNQASVTPGPGFTLPGQTAYNPNSPPPGSIAVNTDFANGLNITDPWA